MLGFLGVAVALWTANEVFGVSKVFGYRGLSNDDAEAKAVKETIQALFDPLGFLTLLGLLVAAVVIHLMARSRVTKGSLIATVLLFVLSFFKVSLVTQMLFSSGGVASRAVQNEPDWRVPAAEDFVLDQTQLIRYRENEGVRISAALTNSTDEHWQSAHLALTFADDAGVECGSVEPTEEFVAPGERIEFTTRFLTTGSYYHDPSCMPVSAAAELKSVDVDSRSEIPAADYGERSESAPPLASLTVSEEPGVVDEVVMVSVVGAVEPSAVEGLRLEDGTASLPLGFEVVDQQGLRVATCLKPKVLEDGSFTTGTHHSPVAQGEFTSVAIVPEC